MELSSGNGRRPHTGITGLRDTPRRMAAAYGDVLTPEPFSFTSFPNEEEFLSLTLLGRRAS